MNRRDVLLASLVPASAAAFSPIARAVSAPASERTIRSPDVLDVRDFGATGDGRDLDHLAINRAIGACHSAGGGTVLVPPGIYRSGSIFLLDNVELHLRAGATILGSRDFSDYVEAPIGPGGATEAGLAMDQDPGGARGRHLIAANHADNVSITGLGMIDGQGSAYWRPSDRPAVAPQDEWADVLARGWIAARERPSPMIALSGCRNVHIGQVRLVGSAGWTLRLLNCADVHVRDLTIRNPTHGPNTDGIDIVASERVFVTGCRIDTGDDAICLKSESLNGEPLAPTRNVVVSDCVLTTGGNGFKIGTASFGRIEDIAFANSVISNEPVGSKRRAIAGLAIEMVDGGTLEGVVVSNIAMRNVRVPIFIRRGARHARADGTPGALRGVRIDNVRAAGAMLASVVAGLPGAPVEDVSITGVTLECSGDSPGARAGRPVPEVAAAYPEAWMFGRLPAFGLYARHLRDFALRDVVYRTAAVGDTRSALVVDDVQNLTIDGLRAGAAGARAPTISLVNARHALLASCVDDAEAPALVEVQGTATEDVLVCCSNLRRPRPLVIVAADVPEGAVEQRP